MKVKPVYTKLAYNRGLLAVVGTMVNKHLCQKLFSQMFCELTNRSTFLRERRAVLPLQTM